MIASKLYDIQKLNRIVDFSRFYGKLVEFTSMLFDLNECAINLHKVGAITGVK